MKQEKRKPECNHSKESGLELINENLNGVEPTEIKIWKQLRGHVKVRGVICTKNNMVSYRKKVFQRSATGGMGGITPKECGGS